MVFDAAQQRLILDLARATIRRALGSETDQDRATSFDDPIFAEPAGCFVTLHQINPHRLRGCVGRIDASRPLGHAVRSSAEAVLEDPRFTDEPVRLDELPLLDIEVSVLSPLQATANPLDFDLLHDGIYLTCEHRSGCFLPQVAQETGWSKEQLLVRLCTEKMGLPASAWRDPEAKLSRFSTIAIGPEPFVPGASKNDS